MDKVSIAELINIHSYLVKLDNPSDKMKEALVKVEEHLHTTLSTMKQMRPAD